MEPNKPIVYEYEDVVAAFLTDVGLAASSSGRKGTAEEKLRAVLSSVSDLFSLEVPTITDNPQENLHLIARDTKLANIARERAMYRMYLMCSTLQMAPGNVMVPMWWGLTDEDGVQFVTQEEFIGWFTSRSGIGRASTFRRIRVYERLAEFGITGKDAWLKVLRMPNTMQELVGMIATWDKNTFEGVGREVAIGIARGVLPGSVADLTEALDSDDVDAIKAAYTPVVQALLEEAESYDNAKQALDHIKHDVLGRATVSYRWIKDEEVIGVTVTTPVIENGRVVTEHQVETVLFIDDADPPAALMADIFKRLPISNRHDLPQ